MREIVLDTETTGLDPATGHRLVEIAAIEISDCIPTGEKFHVYINPQRDMPEEAFRVHGLSAEFLSDKPLFAEVAGDLLQFLGDARLVIHNAEFDMRFLNAEFERAGRPRLRPDQALDTLAMARRKHPGSSNSLDALCARYRIDSARRVKHSALIDAEILAEVYLELIGGRQSALILIEEPARAPLLIAVERPPRPEPLPHFIEREELEAHRTFVETMGKSAIWQLFFEEGRLRA